LFVTAGGELTAVDLTAHPGDSGFWELDFAERYNRSHVGEGCTQKQDLDSVLSKIRNQSGKRRINPDGKLSQVHFVW
jgi:hypothetical protein